MLSFCGMDKCSVDANGRIKLGPRFLEDFAMRGGEIVLHCLPEGAIAVYPEDIYLEMRRSETNPAEHAAGSFVYRRTLRRFGTMSQPERISAQGRITLPQMFRDHADIRNGKEVIVAGVEIGIEIWNVERWKEEQARIHEHMIRKSEQEMEQDLAVTGEKQK